MVHADSHASCGHLIAVEDLGQGVDRAHRDAVGLKLFNQPRAAVPTQQRCQLRDQYLAIGETRGVFRKAGIVGQFSHAQQFTEPSILGVVADGDDDVPVRGLEDLIGDDVGMLVAPTLRDLA